MLGECKSFLRVDWYLLIWRHRALNCNPDSGLVYVTGQIWFQVKIF